MAARELGRGHYHRPDHYDPRVGGPEHLAVRLPGGGWFPDRPGGMFCVDPGHVEATASDRRKRGTATIDGLQDATGRNATAAPGVAERLAVFPLRRRGSLAWH